MRKLVVHLIRRILYIAAMGHPVSPHTTQKPGQVPVLNRADILGLLQSVLKLLNQSTNIADRNHDNEPIQNQSKQQIHFDMYTITNHSLRSKTSTLPNFRKKIQANFRTHVDT